MTERAVRVAAPAVLALFVAVGLAQTRQDIALAAAAGAGAVGLAAVLAWRGARGVPLAVGLAAVACGLAVLGHHQSSNLGWMGLCVIAGWVALVDRPPVAVGTVGFLVLGAVGQWASQTEEPGWAAWIVGTVFTMVACLFARRQRILVEQLREAQAGLAERARAEERNRIAAEMHDVIGHALTVSLMHVSSARLALDDAPDEARDSLLEAERLARASLEEVRASVGLMRERAGSAREDGVAPMPGADELPGLVESFRRAGTPVELEVAGDLGTVGAGRGLAVYRIVQESLTNAARHGDGGPVVVRVEVGERGTAVTVTNPAGRAVAADPGSGLVGMRERAEALGGRLAAGPAAGGWRVEAVLPS